MWIGSPGIADAILAPFTVEIRRTLSMLRHNSAGTGVAFCRDMPLKPNGSLCAIKEQIIEDLASGLILQFECQEGRTRLVIAGKTLPFGNREIIFDGDGREAAAGTLTGEFRRPSWLKSV
jgi:hypothetical protein